MEELHSMKAELQSVMERLRKMAGVEINPRNVSEMSEEEYVRYQCETYNDLEGNLNQTDGYNCERCKNRGYIAAPRFIEGRWYEIHCECGCQKTRSAIRRLIRSGLKDIIRKNTFAKYEATEDWQKLLKSKAIEFSQRTDTDNAWFFIGGQSGAGKTHLCTAIAAAFLKQEKNVQYMLWRDDVMRLKSVVTDSKAYEELINSFKTADVLYIDDLFKTGKDKEGRVQPPTAADMQAAFEILNYRYNSKNLITIISTERTLYELVEIDEAIASRISEMSFDKGYGFNIKPDRAKNHRLRNISDI